MRVGGAGKQPAPVRAAPASVPDGVPSGDERGQIAHGSAGHEGATGGIRPAQQVHDPGQGLVLGMDGPRSGLPDAREDVRCAGGEVEGDRRPGGCGRDVGEVHGIVLRAGGGNEHAVEDLERGLPADAIRCHGRSCGSDEFGLRSGRGLRIAGPGDAFSDPVEYTFDGRALIAPEGFVSHADPPHIESCERHASSRRISLDRTAAAPTAKGLSARSGDREGTAATSTAAW